VTVQPLQSATPALHPQRGASVRNRKSEIVDGLFGLAFFLLYFTTLIPSVLPADNGEFQLVAWKLGIAHPPGYSR
jgi:hypothetical protein